MITCRQLARYGRKKILHKTKVPAFPRCPMLAGTCVKVRIDKPKKPNSANRKIARVRLSNFNFVTAYIPGQGHVLQEHSVVLVRGGRTKDLPGVRYKLIRGKKDFLWEERFLRRKRRSKFGVPKPKTN